ncbi:ATP-binding protein [Streptomyces sp. NPDC094032]|uniref:ATP-binding protein n=1 Tax=Streptomyces sp. NPDC094032 TaxID=3155308 RepID=UPI00332B9F47
MTSPQTREEPVTVRVFTQRFSSTPRGARLARRLVLHQLDRWGIPHGSAASDATAQIVAELAANAVTHGRVPGRDFEVVVSYTSATPDPYLRIDVSDTRTERHPRLTDAGRGLRIVDALATRWEILARVPVGKTVRAEVELSPRRREGAGGSGGVPSGDQLSGIIRRT